MKNKFPFPYKIQKELTALAKSMPAFERLDEDKQPMYEIEKKVMMGADIPEADRPEKFDPKKKYKYSIKVPVMVDHKQNLFKIYKEEGQDGVELYVKFFHGEQDKIKLLEKIQGNGDN